MQPVTERTTRLQHQISPQDNINNFGLAFPNLSPSGANEVVLGPIRSSESYES